MTSTAVLFDLDGTLINSLPSYVKAYQDTLSDLGFDFDERQVIDTCFYKTDEQICESLGVLDKLDIYKQSYRSHKDFHFSNAPLFPGVKETLDLLRNNNVKMGVITLAEGWYLQKMLARYELGSYFESTISSDDVVNPKPDPESVEKSCAKLSVNAADVVVVGDSRGDILMGQNAGTKTALFLPNENAPYTDFELLKTFRPTYSFTAFSELSKLLEMK